MRTKQGIPDSTLPLGATFSIQPDDAALADETVDVQAQFMAQVNNAILRAQKQAQHSGKAFRPTGSGSSRASPGTPRNDQ